MAGQAEKDEAALDRRLARDPRDLVALLGKGDRRAQTGDLPGATSFYQAAVAIAERLDHVPPALYPGLRRADAFLVDAETRYRRFLEDWLDAHGVTPERRSAPFRESLDILLGRRGIYQQKPTTFFFPGLPQIQFFDPALFSWARDVERATPAIRAELDALLAEGTPFRPYHASRPDRAPSNAHGLMNNPDWSTCYLRSTAGRHEEVIARCPRTMAALEELPIPSIAGTAPSIFFSLLRPGARIAAHHGIMNTRLVCHLPLIVPGRCGIRVGNEARQWEVGKLLIFDDSIEHEAWNESASARVVLIFEIWRPEIADADRRAIAAVFEAANDYSQSAKIF